MTRSTPAYKRGFAAQAALYAAGVFLMAGCATDPWFGSRPASSQWAVPAHQGGVQAGYYRANPGDTLASVAAGFGQRPQDVAEWNRLPATPMAALRPGQILRVVPPVSTNANVGGAPAIRFAWPAYGDVLKPVQPAGAVRGIVIAGRAGDPVRAAADGTVIYVGSAVAQYTTLVIIKHGEALVTAYSLNLPVANAGDEAAKGQALLVREGDTVRKGQAIAYMGPDRMGRSTLQFEIRREGTPIDPLAFLPR